MTSGIRAKLPKALGLALIIAGILVAGVSIWQMTGADNLTASQQQGAAEAEPLVIPVHDGPAADLEVGTVFAKLYARVLAMTTLDKLLRAQA